MLISNIWQKRHQLAGALLVVTLPVIAIVIWQMVSKGDYIDAQEAVEDACLGFANYTASYDITIQGTVTFGTESMTGNEDWRIQGENIYRLLTATKDGVSIQAEHIEIATRNDNTDGASGGSGAGSRTRYYRGADATGTWGEWKTDVNNIAPFADMSGAAGESDSEEIPASFCGRPLLSDDVSDTTSGHIGEEITNGTNTKHYFYLIASKSQPEENYSREDFWIDPTTGRFVQIKRTIVQPPNTRLETLHSYSGWGEPNVITAPVLSTPTQEPNATTTPRPPHPRD